jgi:hypothetical protein
VPRDMFGDIADPQIKMGSKQGASVLLTMVAEAVILGALVIIPLMAAEVLPTPPCWRSSPRHRHRPHHRRRPHPQPQLRQSRWWM